jgi:hypothetical protein
MKENRRKWTRKMERNWTGKRKVGTKRVNQK